MAIHSSLAVGSARKSMGGMTYVKLKGQNVVKQQVPKKGKISLANRSPSQNRMSNSVLAWQFLTLFLVNIIALRTSTESNYNAFVRLANSYFTAVIAGSRSLAASMLSDNILGSGNFVNVSSLDYATNICTVTFLTGGLPFVENSYVKAIVWIAATGSNQIVTRLLTEAEWTAGSAILVTTFANPTLGGAYIYNSSLNKCSDICFLQA